MFCTSHVTSTPLDDLGDYVIFYSHGPRLRQFLKDHEVAGSYKGEPMTGKVTEDNFHTILTTLENRFTDVSEDVVAATRIANFRQWPLFSMKEDVTGKVSSSTYKSFKIL